MTSAAAANASSSSLSQPTLNPDNVYFYCYDVFNNIVWPAIKPHIDVIPPLDLQMQIRNYTYFRGFYEDTLRQVESKPVTPDALADALITSARRFGLNI